MSRPLGVGEDLAWSNVEKDYGEKNMMFFGNIVGKDSI